MCGNYAKLIQRNQFRFSKVIRSSKYCFDACRLTAINRSSGDWSTVVELVNLMQFDSELTSKMDQLKTN